MMGFLTTWAVDGSRSPAAVARMATFASTSGAEGVVAPDHCKLVPLGGGSVGLTAGVVLVRAGSSGTAQWQTYAAAVDSTDAEATATVPMPSGSARTFQAVVCIPDPQWAGVPEPADPLTATYAELRLLTTAQYQALTIPHYRVATVAIPADASVITEAMITDRRKVAIPRRQRELFVRRLNSGDPEDRLDNNDGAGEQWPDISWTYTVPEWATSVKVVSTYASVLFPGGDVRGYLWAKPFGNAGPQTINTTISYNLSGASRQTLVAAASLAVPAQFRGQSVNAYLAGTLQQGLADSRPRIVPGSSIVLDLDFEEAPI